MSGTWGLRRDIEAPGRHHAAIRRSHPGETTTPKKDNGKKADDTVIDVETTEAGPSTRLPALKAPTIEPLGGWKQVKHNNLVHSHIYGFNYHEPSRTMGAYYAQFSELLLPAATDSDSDSEEELQSMIETHNMWSPFHYDYVQDVNPPRTYYICVEDSELQAWENSNRTTLKLTLGNLQHHGCSSTFTYTNTLVEALNYVVALIHNSMSTTLPPWGERLHLIALNLYPATTVGRHLMEYYHRDGSDYKELENHSDALQGIDKFTTSTTVISGPNYDYVDDDTSILQEASGGHNYNLRARAHLLQKRQEHVPASLRRDGGVPQGEQPKLLAAVVGWRGDYARRRE